ncbi:hypothetical protein SGLAM104S_07458 [Streptomyces glaucescens]
MPTQEKTGPAMSATTSHVPTPAWPMHRTSRSERPERVTVAVYAADPVLRLGVVQQLRQRPEIDLLADTHVERAEVSLVVVDQVDDDVAALLHRLRHNTDTRTGRWSPPSVPARCNASSSAVWRRCCGAPKPTRTNSWAWCWR